MYREKVHRLISHLVGHEGGGSLLSALKSRGWVNGLSAGQSHANTSVRAASTLFL
jgi:secreted Zn-dependent insulinase-like peptidase